MIAQQLADCPSSVFQTIIPPLLALAGLPRIGNYSPVDTIAVSASYDVADLSLTVLSFLGKPGPSGLLLKEVCQHFIDHPEHLRLLARYSLECGTLITPTVVPLLKENYERYETAIGQWIELRDKQNSSRISELAIDRCVAIHRELLASPKKPPIPA